MLGQEKTNPSPFHADCRISSRKRYLLSYYLLLSFVMLS